MIARTWRGWASAATADDYQHHYETEVAEHLQQVPGFCGARLLRLVAVGVPEVSGVIVGPPVEGPT